MNRVMRAVARPPCFWKTDARFFATPRPYAPQCPATWPAPPVAGKAFRFHGVRRQYHRSFGHQPDAGRRQLPFASGAVRLRQGHGAAHDRGADAADLGSDPVERHPCPWRYRGGLSRADADALGHGGAKCLAAFRLRGQGFAAVLDRIERTRTRAICRVA